MSGKKIKKRKSAFSIFHQPTHTQKAPYLHETHNAWATGAEKKKKKQGQREPQLKKSHFAMIHLPVTEESSGISSKRNLKKKN